MTDGIPDWTVGVDPRADRGDPAPDADERTALDEWLDWHRRTLVAKVVGLDDQQARRQAVPPSDLNLLGLLRHMTEVERNWFRRCFAGLDAAPLYYGDAHPTGDPDGDMRPGDHDTVADALRAWEQEVAFARALVARTSSLDDVAATPRDRYPEQPNLRWIMVHMIEEYARHNGHADLLRECIDGTTGD